MDNDNNKKNVPGKSVMTIRLLVGCYLLYIDHSLLQNIGEYKGIQKIVIIGFMILFLVAGGYLLIKNGMLLWNDWKQERETRDRQEAEIKQENVPVQRSIAENAAIVESIDSDGDVTDSGITEEDTEESGTDADDTAED